MHSYGALLRRATLNSITTIYPNELIEWSNSVLTKYYFANGQRVAIRTPSALTYLLSDHLGSAAVALDTTSSIVL